MIKIVCTLTLRVIPYQILGLLPLCHPSVCFCPLTWGLCVHNVYAALRKTLMLATHLRRVGQNRIYISVVQLRRTRAILTV
jgi:hypothetical protein